MSDETPKKAILATKEDKRWLTIFDEIEANQLNLLDQSGKRIVELTSVLLGVLLGATSFGDKFPPDYLGEDTSVKYMVIAVLIFYILAMLAGMWTAFPREYKRYPNNLTQMEAEFKKIIANKRNALSVAGGSFLLGSILLAALLAQLVWTA